MRLSSTCPLLTAFSIDEIVFSSSPGISMRSMPAFTHIRATSDVLKYFVMPFIFRASVTTSPLKPRFSISRPFTILDESEAGICSPDSSTGNERCAIITDITLLAMAFLKGTSSIELSLSISKFNTGKSLCESISVSPCPGKCLAVAITFPSCSPFIIEAESFETS